MSISSKLAWQFLGIPPESFRNLCNGSNGIKIVGNENDLKELKNYPPYNRQARLITAEAAIEAAKSRNDLDEIPSLVESTIVIYENASKNLNLPDVWWEIPPIMPPANEWVAQWNAAMIPAMKKKNIRSVGLGFALGYPQVKPFATVSDPDKWPVMYPTLQAIHDAGRNWSRLGVEEYILNGSYDPNDKSSICRTDYVYQYHIEPHGWLIDTSVIEVGWDVPAMLDIKGMSPTLCWDGLGKVDIEYSKRSRIAVAYIYAVLDPTVFTNESKFAFTPGNIHDPIGYLNKGQAYFAINKPTVYDPGDPIQIPNPQPEPTPTPDPQPSYTEIKLINSDFSGAWNKQNAQQTVPEGWSVWYDTKQGIPNTEEELHPSHTLNGKPSARIWFGYAKGVGGFFQKISANVGSIYQFVIDELGTATAVVDSPSDGFNSRSIGIDPTGGTDGMNPNIVWCSPDVVMDKFKQLNVTVVAKNSQITLFTKVVVSELHPHNDGFFSNAHAYKVADTIPVIPDDGKRKVIDIYQGQKVNSLHIRTAPSIHAPIIGSLNPNIPSIMIDINSEKLVTEDGNSVKWIQLSGQSLWVASAYLMKL